MERLKTESGTGAELREQMEDLAFTGKPLRNREGIELVWVKPGTLRVSSPENEPSQTVSFTNDECWGSGSFRRNRSVPI